MRFLSVLAFSVLFSSHAYPFYNIDDAEFVGIGTVSTGNSVQVVKSNLSILATSDVGSEKFVSGGFVGKDIGILTFEFWANFSDEENFIILKPVEKWFGNGYLEIGDGRCVYVKEIGKVCRYSRIIDNSAVSETLTFQDNGNLLRNGSATIGGQKISYSLILHPKENKKNSENNNIVEEKEDILKDEVVENR